MRIRLLLLYAAATLLLIVPLAVLGKPATGSWPSATATPTDEPEPLCGTLGRLVENRPIFSETRFCPEYLLQELPRTALPAITSIAYAPVCDLLDEPRGWCGALFFTRPDEGTLNWIGAFHPDTLTYDVNVFASSLTTPNGLAWHDGAWYVSGGQNVYRLADEDGDLVADSVEVVIDDLPEGAGFWTGSVGFGPDGRLYVSKGAGCNACEEDPRRGTILSYEPDGNDGRIFAGGLRSAFDFAWHPASGDLWTADAGRDGLGEDLPLEELNHASRPGQHFGWPYCYTTADGVTADESVPSPDEDFCQQRATGPELTFPARSNPAGMAFYSGEAFPELEGDLLIVASGSWNRRIPSGYALIRVCFDAAGAPEICRDGQGQPIRDAQGQLTLQEVLVPFVGYLGHSLEDLHIHGQSFFPDHPIDVTISPEGWIVISEQEGRLIQLRPMPSWDF